MKNHDMDNSDKEKNIRRAFSGRIQKVGYPLWPSIAARIAAGERPPRTFTRTLASFAYMVALMLVGVFIGNFVSVYKTSALPEGDLAGFVDYRNGNGRGTAERSKDLLFKTE